jgi:4-methyl-5(b-hydroxyethyl)-thiazole monophosphate biosynthesis
MKVAIMLAEGFEPIEAITCADVLRRGQVDVELVKVSSQGQACEALQVLSAHDIIVQCDRAIGSADLDAYDCILLPGGIPGVTNLAKSEKLTSALKAALNNSERYVAAICAAPMILTDLGLLEGRSATCYPGCENNFPEGAYVKAPAVVSGNLITGEGPALATEFALQVLEVLKGENARKTVANGMLA